MNLAGIVQGAIGVINPRVSATIRRSTGFTTVNYKQVPSYAVPDTVMVQKQPLTFKDLMQLDGLNLQGEKAAIYISGSLEGVRRVDSKGGDLLTILGEVWLVVQVLEKWNDTAGWCKVAAVLQMDTP